MKTVPDIEATPREVRWSDMGEFDRLDERVSAVTTTFGSVIGVNEGYVEWCPDAVPPTELERLAWIWLCNPALDAEILPLATGRFRELMLAYRGGAMDRWWDVGGDPPAASRPPALSYARPSTGRLARWMLWLIVTDIGLLVLAVDTGVCADVYDRLHPMGAWRGARVTAPIVDVLFITVFSLWGLILALAIIAWVRAPRRRRRRANGATAQ